MASSQMMEDIKMYQTAKNVLELRRKNDRGSPTGFWRPLSLYAFVYARILIDGAQSIIHVPVNVSALEYLSSIGMPDVTLTMEQAFRQSISASRALHLKGKKC